MKKLLLFFALTALAAGAGAQTLRDKNTYVGGVSYQTEFRRFGIQGQGRYVIDRHFRLAPDVVFHFPKDQVTGLDLNLNVHYVLTACKLALYPLAGIGLQTNFYANSELTDTEGVLAIRNHTGSDFAVNVGAGADYPLTDKCFITAEAKVMIGAKHNLAVMIGIGRRF